VGSESAARRDRHRPAALCAGGLLLLAAAVYGPHVVNGGFYWDDWQLAARERFPVELPRADVRGVFDLELLAYRPLMGLLLPGIHALLGAEPHLHLLVAQAVGVAMSLLVFLVLRELRVGPWAAAAVAALAFVFPWGDSVRLWATPALNGIAVIAYLTGVLLALRGRGRGAALGAPPLFAAATLLYEAVAPAALLTFLLYRTRGGWASALRRGAADWAAVGMALVVVARNTTREVQPLGSSLDHARVIADQALTIASQAVLPVDGFPRGIGLALLAALVMAGIAVVRRLDAADPRAAALRWAGALGVGSVLAIAVAYAAYVPGPDRYQPLAEGVGNRVGLLAAFPYAVLVVAAASALGVLVSAAFGRPGVAPVATGVLVSVVGAAWIDRTAGHAREWDRSAALQDTVIAALRHAVPKPPPNAVLYTTGAPIYAAPGVPVFSVSWDLRGAVRLHYDRRDVRAYALPVGRGLVCTGASAFPDARAYGPPQAGGYGRAFVVDVPTRSAVRLRSRATCRRVSERLTSGTALARRAAAAPRGAARGA
jgi:hypothetical protein